MYNLFGVGRGPQIYKKRTKMGVTIGGDAAKSGKNTHLVVIMHVRLSQKIGLLDLKNWNRFKKETDRNNVRKVCAITSEFV